MTQIYHVDCLVKTKNQHFLVNYNRPTSLCKITFAMFRIQQKINKRTRKYVPFSKEKNINRWQTRRNPDIGITGHNTKAATITIWGTEKDT